MTLDGFNVAILNALQKDGAITNAALSEQVNLSASQCSRRRAALEAGGLIAGYCARLDAEKLGYGLRAIVRVNLRSHGGTNESSFASFIARRPEVRAAFSVSGDADYILDLRTPDLESFARFIHEHLLPEALVAQVRSEIVLKTLKDAPGVDLLQLPVQPR